MKKLVAILLCAVLSGSVITALADPVLGGYNDVPADSWYGLCVQDVTSLGLMNGTGSEQFSPEAPLTRAMLVTVLWRMNGAPQPKEALTFTDVDAGQWYSNAIAWAAEQKVVEGIGESRFAPNDWVGKEQMATIFFRFAKAEGFDVSSLNDEMSIDAKNAEPWAAEAVDWAISRHLLTKRFYGGLPHGDSGYFYCVGDHANRAEVAVFLSRYCLEYLDAAGQIQYRNSAVVSQAALVDGTPALVIATPDIRQDRQRQVVISASADGGGHWTSFCSTEAPVIGMKELTIDGQSASWVSVGSIEDGVWFRILYSAWGDPLFVEVELPDGGEPNVYALYYSTPDYYDFIPSGTSVISGWGEDAYSLHLYDYGASFKVISGTYSFEPASGETAEFHGETAVLLTDAILTNCYSGMTDSIGRITWTNLPENKSLQQGDVVFALQESNGKTMVYVPTGDTPLALYGELPSDVLSQSTEDITQGNLADAAGSVAYDRIDGKKVETLSGYVSILKRDNGWCQVQPLAGGDTRLFWIRSNDLSYSFNTLVVARSL